MSILCSCINAVVTVGIVTGNEVQIVVLDKRIDIKTSILVDLDMFHLMTEVLPSNNL